MLFKKMGMVIVFLGIAAGCATTDSRVSAGTDCDAFVDRWVAKNPALVTAEQRPDLLTQCTDKRSDMRNRQQWFRQERKFIDGHS